MEPLAAAKMKATTTVTLFIIIFLIAAWWSTVDVNAAEAPGNRLCAVCDRAVCAAADSCMCDLCGAHVATYVETKIEQIAKPIVVEPIEQIVAIAKLAQLDVEQIVDVAIAKLDVAIAKLDVAMADMGLDMDVADSDRHVVVGDRHVVDRHVGVGQEQPELHTGHSSKVDNTDMDKEKKMESEKKEEKGYCVSCNERQRHHMGNIWITVGFSTICFFFMALTLRVFRDLEKQRKSCRKTHAFPVDDLGGVTNLLG